jgi:hypothetical protein
MMNFFSAPNRYGRYPFEKYGMVEAYPFAWGGMEHQTMTTVHHYWVEYGSDNGIAHEMAHMWWGDMVTCQDWREIWLNEGFATYSDELYKYHQSGRASFISLINQRAQDYFDEDATGRHPLYNPGINRLFDWGHSYCKGAWVQHMLRLVVGDTVWEQPGIFFQALRAYGDSLRYGTATTEDYKRILEQQTGHELDWFFDEWIYQAGYPNYTINWNWQPAGSEYQVNLSIAQNNGAQAPGCFHMPLPIAIRMGTRDSAVLVPITANPCQASYLVSAQPTALLADPGSWLLDKAALHVGVEGVTASELARPLAVEPTVVREAGSIRYTIGRAGYVDVAVFDGSGRRVRTLASGLSGAGTHRIRWDGRREQGDRLTPGVYFCRLTTQDRCEQMKLMLVR